MEKEGLGLEFSPRNVSPEMFLRAVHGDRKFGIRVFADRDGGGILPKKYAGTVEDFRHVEPKLREDNAAYGGIFHVVNDGGNTDRDIDHVNAFFVDLDDGTFEEQEGRLNVFPLLPSLVVRTRKSYHAYWLVRDADPGQFPGIQKRLAEALRADPACVNLSRVLRIPGFYHCKKEPVMVTCVWYHPEQVYTQREMETVLAYHTINMDRKITQSISLPAPEKRPIPLEEDVPGLETVLKECRFIQYCRENAETLCEPLWYAMISNLARFEGGREAIHELSRPYKGYSEEQTDRKIQHALNSDTNPITCNKIAEWGYKCPQMESKRCSCRSPYKLKDKPPALEDLIKWISDLPCAGDQEQDLATASSFVREKMKNVKPSVGAALIENQMMEQLRLKKDLFPILKSFQQNEYSSGQAKKRKEKKKNADDELPPWYDIDGEFLPGILAEHLAQTVRAFYVGGQYHLYEEGVYSPISDLAAKNIVREKLVQMLARLSHVTDAEGLWRMQVLRDPEELNPDPYIINLKNGLYNVRTKTLEEHSPDYLSTIQIHAKYMQGAECPRFIQYLNEVLPEDQIPLVQEILGLLLVPVTKAQKAFLFVGKADAGKSILLQVISLLLGKEYVSNVTWQALGERFKTAELFGKLANIFADLPTSSIEDNGIFKALTGEDDLTVERKNKDPFSFQSTARMVFSCNSIPKNLGDRSEGFYRRLLIIRFEHPVPKEKRDTELIEKLEKELDGIFQFALEGLNRLVENHYRFSETERNLQEVDQYRRDSNSVLAFVDECCVVEETAECSRKELYEQYKKYCETCGVNPFAQRNFNNELESHLQVQRTFDKVSRRKNWTGIRFVSAVE